MSFTVFHISESVHLNVSARALSCIFFAFLWISCMLSLCFSKKSRQFGKLGGLSLKYSSISVLSTMVYWKQSNHWYIASTQFYCVILLIFCSFRINLNTQILHTIKYIWLILKLCLTTNLLNATLFIILDANLKGFTVPCI